MIDPNHAGKRRSLTTTSLAFCVIGAFVAAYAAWRFGQSFFIPTEAFFANPNAVTDAQKANGFIGVACFGVGSLLLALGLKGALFARAGSLLRFAAAETVPVVENAMHDAGLVKVRCRGCSRLEREDATFCSGRGKAI